MVNQVQYSTIPEIGFLDRVKEQAFFKDVLTGLKKGKLSRHILNVWGIGGVGKSTLLEQGFQQIARQSDCEFVYINFEPNSEQLAVGYVRIDNLPECVNRFSEFLQQAGIPLKQAHKHSRSTKGNNTALEMAKAIQKDLAAYLEERTLVLVLDGLTQIEPWFSQLEDYLIAPLINKKFLLVIGSRNPVRLDRLELRLQLDFYPLEPLRDEPSRPDQPLSSLYLALTDRFGLNPDNSSAQLKPLCLQLQQISGLHPGALNFLLSQLELKPGKLEQAQRMVDEQADRLKQALMKYILEKFVTSPNTIPERQEQIKLAIQEMAVYRRFDVGMLQQTVTTGSEELKKVFQAFATNPLFFTALSQDMVSTQMVRWDVKRRGFVIEENYRHILEAGLEAQDRLAFQKRHEVAIQQYLRLLQSRSGDDETRAIYAIEWLYHILKAQAPNRSDQLHELNNYLLDRRLPGINVFLSSPEAATVALPSREEISRVFQASETRAINEKLAFELNKASDNMFNWLLNTQPEPVVSLPQKEIPTPRNPDASTIPRLINHYGFVIPLFGQKINQCLNEVEEALKSGQGGQVFYIEGEGGSGKSELLLQLQQIANNLTRSSEKLPKLPIFGGVVDLYDYVSYSARGIERSLITHWDRFSQVNKLPWVDSPSNIFSDYLEADNKFQRLRYSIPILHGALKLITGRREELDRHFRKGLEDLSQHYLPVICLDTAELLEEEEDSTHITDALNWLADLLRSEYATRCVVIVAGRPKNELGKPVKVMVGENESKPLKSYLEEACHNHTGVTFKECILKKLQPDEIKSYIYWYHLKYSKPDTQIELEMSSLEAFEQQARQNWLEVVADLKRQGAIPEHFKASEDEQKDEVCQALEVLTGGKPLWIDWLCQIAYKLPLNNPIPGLTNKQRPDTSEFKRTLLNIIVNGQYDFIVDPEKTLSSEKIKQVLRYACVTRKGLDQATVLILAEEEAKTDQRKRLSESEAKRALEVLQENPFIKVRVPGPENTLVYLHDEIFQGLIQDIEIALGPAFVGTMAAALVQAYSNNPGYPRSLQHILLQINEIRQVRLQLDPFDGRVIEWGWFEDNDLMDKFLKLQDELQNRLVERLYYRLKSNFHDGYDEYCIVALMAIVEYEIGLDTLLKKEYLRYERLQHRKMEEEETWKQFALYRNLEGRLRRIKREFRDSKVSLKQQEVIKKLTGIAKEAEETLANLPEFKDPIQSKIRDRLWICQADALISINDYVNPIVPDDPNVEQQSYEYLTSAIKLVRQIEISPELQERLKHYQAGEIRSYIYWQSRVLLGRAYHTLGQIYRNLWSLDRAAEAFLLSIQYYKEAVNRVEVYLNDTRNSLARTFNLSGQQGLALETNELSLQSQMRRGHKIYVALAESMRALILVGTDQTVTQAYRFVQRAFKHIIEDLRPDEYDKLEYYWNTCLLDGEITRRLGRSYGHASYEQASKLHKRAIERLKATYSYYKTPEKNRFRRVQTLKELGCAYRSQGRTLQQHLDSLENQFKVAPVESEKDQLRRQIKEIERERDKAFSQAYDFLCKAQHECDENKELFWHYSLDNLLDLAQLATYQFQFERSVEKSAVEAALTRSDEELKELESSLAQANPAPEDLTLIPLSEIRKGGKQQMLNFFKGRNQMQHADWAWKCYVRTKKKEDPLLRDYINYQVNALVWFIEFQPQILLNERDYSHTLSYITRIDIEINSTINGYKERAVAVEEVGELLDDQRTKRGARLFAYLLDLDLHSKLS